MKIKLAIVFNAVLSCACFAQGNAALDAFKEIVAKRQVAFEALHSYKTKCQFEVAISEDYAKLNGSAREGRKTLDFTAVGERMKMVEDIIDSRNDVIASSTYYLDPLSVTVVHGGSVRLATIFPLAKGPNYGIFDAPVFLEYSFLGVDIGEWGAPALRVSDLVQKEKWMSPMSSIKDVSFGQDGALSVSFQGPRGASSVEFAPRENKQFDVKKINFYHADGQLDRSIEVLGWVDDKALGRIANECKISVCCSNPGAPPSAVWHYKITDLQFNVRVKPAEIEFDSASVNTIVDDANNETIPVPK